GRYPHRRLPSVAEAVESDPTRVDPGKRLEPVGNLLMLGDHDGEKRLLERIGLALERPEAVLEDVEILGCKRDKSSLGQPDGKLMIRRIVHLGVGDIAWTPLQAMLADHDRTFLSGLDPLGKEEDAVGDHVWEHVHHDLVAGESRLIMDPSRADIGWHSFE